MNEEKGSAGRIAFGLVGYWLSIVPVAFLCLALAMWLVEINVALGIVAGLGGLIAYTGAFIYFVRRTPKERVRPAELIARRKAERSADLKTRVSTPFLWPLVAIFLVIPAIGILTSLFGSLLGSFTVSAVTLVLAGLGFAYYQNQKIVMKRTDRVVLWLRRFHEDSLFPFELVLEDICGGIALPLTVADTTVPDSKLARTTHPLVIVGAALMMVGFGAGFSLLGTTPGVTVATIAVPLLAVGGGLLFFGMRLGGRKDLRTERGQQVLEEILLAVDNREPLPATMAVVRMSDKNWKTWVGGFIERADAVIMDITHLTDSLGWELNACKETLAPQQLILACGWYDDDDQDPWPALEQKLEQFLGAEYVAQCQRFTYERPRKVNWFVSQYRHQRAIMLRRRYEETLLTCFSAAFDAHDARPGSNSTEGAQVI